MTFQLLDLDANLLSQRMRDVFKSLVDVNVSYPIKNTKEGYLRSIPSNYGYVFFWFGFLDEEALSKYYKEYLSKDELTKLEDAKKQRLKQYEDAGIKEREGLFQISDFIRDTLFPIVYEHPDAIGNGLAEVHLAIFFDDDLKEATMDEAISILKRQAEKLEELRDFNRKYLEKQIKNIEDIEFHYETFTDSDNIEGWEIILRISFDGDETLRDVVERIDKIISPLKEILNKTVRYESSYFPF